MGKVKQVGKEKKGGVQENRNNLFHLSHPSLWKLVVNKKKMYTSR